MGLAPWPALAETTLEDLRKQAGRGDAKASWTRALKLRPTGPTGHPAQPSANSSAQQGADLLRLIDYRQRKGEPGKFALVKLPHIHQGYNNCGSTACATFARFQGGTLGGWDYKRLCPSPLGTGTDWGHLLEASQKIGQSWKLITFTPDDAGLEGATALLKSELDAGRPVVVDFKYIGPQYPNGSAGHTLNVCGYLAEENLHVLCNPAVATPGLQLITAADLKDFWRSDHYGALSKGILSRPAFVIDKPRGEISRILPNREAAGIPSFRCQRNNSDMPLAFSPEVDCFLLRQHPSAPRLSPT